MTNLRTRSASTRVSWLLLLSASVALSFAAVPTASAQQVVDASDGKPRIVQISQRDPSRIAMESTGRLVTLVFDSNDLTATKDDANGQVFVTPRTARPISIFVVTDKATHPLVLQPQDVPLQTILIREGRQGSADGRPLARTVIEKASALDLAVKRLVTAMARGERPVEFSVRDLQQPLALWRDTAFVLVARYEGRSFVGEHYRLTYTGPSVMRVAEQELFKEGVVAVSVEIHELSPGATTDVFVVRVSNG